MTRQLFSVESQGESLDRPDPKWPKRLPALTAEQRRIRDEFMALWHEVLPQRFGLIERFNHGYPVRRRPGAPFRTRTLELGAGLGGHIPYERLDDQEYVAVELRPEMAARIRQRFATCHVVAANCESLLPFGARTFDRALAIHVLEHLPDLPAAIREVHRVLKPGGQFCVVIPCEGGSFYTLCRNISARRVFEAKFKQPYDWLIRSEHINVPREIFEELGRLFVLEDQCYFPLLVPATELNLCIGLTLRPV